MVKTNVIYLLNVACIVYETDTYEVNENDLPGSHAAGLMRADHDRVYKTLAPKGEKRGYLVCYIPVDEELNLRETARATGEKEVEMIHIKDVFDITGYIHRGYSPIDMRKHLPTCIEEMTQLYNTIMVSVDQRGVQVTLLPEDLKSHL